MTSAQSSADRPAAYRVPLLLPVNPARHVGRVGALAVALGIGAWVASAPAVALADSGSDGSTASESASTSAPRAGAHARAPRTADHSSAPSAATTARKTASVVGRGTPAAVLANSSALAAPNSGTNPVAPQAEPLALTALAYARRDSSAARTAPAASTSISRLIAPGPAANSVVGAPTAAAASS